MVTPFFQGFTKESDCRRERGYRVAGRVRPHRCRGKRAPFAGKWCMAGRRGGPAGGEGVAAAPLFCLFKAAIPEHSGGDRRCRSPAVPPFSEGRKAALPGGGFSQGAAGACAGEVRPLHPGGSAPKGGTVALALGVKNWYPEGRYRARCWRAGTEKGGEGQWSGSTFTWKICGSTT